MNLYGASGHAKVIIDIAYSRNKIISQIFDDNPTIKKIMGYQVDHNPIQNLNGRIPTIIAIGNSKIRKRVAASITGKIHPFLAHQTAVISPSAIVGDGTVLMANTSVNAKVSIGKHCIVNTGAIVEHDTELEDYVHISPNGSIAGNVKIGEGTHIGIGACVIPGIKIGKWVTVGAGAIIIEDIPSFATVVGNPGRIIKFNKENE